MLWPRGPIIWCPFSDLYFFNARLQRSISEPSNIHRNFSFSPLFTASLFWIPVLLCWTFTCLEVEGKNKTKQNKVVSEDWANTGIEVMSPTWVSLYHHLWHHTGLIVNTHFEKSGLGNECKKICFPSWGVDEQRHRLLSENISENFYLAQKENTKSL